MRDVPRLHASTLPLCGPADGLAPGPVWSGNFQGILQDAQGFGQLRVRRHQRREEADDVAVHAALDHQQPAFARRVDHPPGQGGVGLPISGHHLDRLHEAEPADLANGGILGRQDA